MVEQRTENPRVVGSIPTGGTNADLAHLVERDLAKVEVAGSSPVIRSNKKESHPIGWLSFLLSRLAGARTLVDFSRKSTAGQVPRFACKRRRGRRGELSFSKRLRFENGEHP